MKKVVSVFLMMLCTVVAMAQSANMMNMARGELEKRGLTEAEVRTRLMERGIDVDNIPPTEYPAYQDRVMDILDEMQREKAAQTANNALGAESANALFTVTETPQTTTGEAAAEDVLAENLKEKNDSSSVNDIYGHSLFTRTSMDIFRTTDGAQAPDTYVLGEGDEVHISIFGASQTEIHQRIGADGSIQPAGSTKIFLKGLTLAQGRQAIKTRLSQHYSFRPDQIAVAITTARTVSVSIYGDVAVQGGFTLSALNTALNALAAAGGPTEKGSVRDIQIFRGGKAGKLDLYKYMTSPTDAGWYDLQNGDVIFVPVAQCVVSIEGAVNRPMRYEMLPSEGLKEAVTYAGGLDANADSKFIQVERFSDGEKKFLEYDLSAVMSGAIHVPVMNGDVIRLRKAEINVENYVAVKGDVYFEGTYDLAQNERLSKLLNTAKPRYTARTDYVFVERTHTDETVEVLTVPFPGAKGNPDFYLQARDTVLVLQQSAYRDVDTISVSGAVRKPFVKEFGLNDRMTVGQAVEYAGGLKTNVYPVAYIFRKDVTNPDKMQYIRVSLDKDKNQQLQAGDQLRIYDNSTYANVGEVRVSGAVKEAFGTPFDASLTLHDLLCMAGGFEVGAAYDRVEVFRQNISRTAEVQFERITLSVDDDYYPIGGDFQIQPYDQIVVRMTPNFTTGRSVEINGRVKYPGVYILEDTRTQLSEVIALAGGLLDDADPSCHIFRTFNNRGPIGANLKEMKKHKGRLSSDPVLMEGDVINIVRQENTVTIREVGTRIAQYVPDEYESSQRTVIYQGEHNAKWYIDTYAGGLQKTADRASVMVTTPNGQSLGTKKALWVFHNYPKVQPGSVITVAMDPKKVEKAKEPKEKVDWERTTAQALSSVTSIVSIILLLERL